MNKKYQILILITFLIAIFFFAKWIYGVVPRYEVKEEILKCDDYVFNKNQINCLDDGGIEFYKSYENVIDYFHNGHNCYIKYKERIN